MLLTLITIFNISRRKDCGYFKQENNFNTQTNILVDIIKRRK